MGSAPTPHSDSSGIDDVDFTGVQNLLTKREACIQAALTLKEQLNDCESKLESQGRELNLRLERISGERDRMADQISILERDLKTALAATESLAVEKRSADTQLRVRFEPSAPAPIPNPTASQIACLLTPHPPHPHHPP